ncbi:hypothetical protein [Actinomadura decatromicini]|uniref:hypothetical protein n=1 Tax=Actinomadura decatromicini TaxID=2604572 RepID=UPI001652EAF6|nr:hypothetical protein [Actinomadura decatromicini]
MSLDPALPASLDTGISATGPWSGTPEHSSFHIALGDDPDGKAFLTELRNAITKAKTA